MKKYMLLNMLMVFGVMQTSDLLCMHQLIKLTRSTNSFSINGQSNIQKILGKKKFCKSFRRYNTLYKDNRCWTEIAEFFEEEPGWAVLCVSGAIGFFFISVFVVVDVIDEIDKKINRFREENAKSMCSNLEYVLQNKPCNIAKAKFIIRSQPKVVKYVNVKSYCCSEVITRAVAENNKPMVNLFKENFVMDMSVLNKFVEQKNHEDPKGMANLLIQWPNSGKVFASFNCNCNSYENQTGCKIIQKESARIRDNLHIEDEKRRLDDHEEYIKSLQN